MAALEDIVNMMEQLVIANKTPQDPEQRETYFRSTINLVRTAKCNIRNARSVLKDPNAGNFVSGSLTVLHALRTINTGVTETTCLKKALEDLVISHIFLLSKTNSEVQELLSYFKHDIITILRDVLDSSGTGEPHFLRILEQCYKQALDDAGTIYCHKYFNHIDEVSLISPYDPDYESEQFYEREERMHDERYAARVEAERERKCTERMTERKRTKRAWIEFWSRALQNHPGGPTLFLPADLHQTKDLPPTPKYLFRAFDANSSGNSDYTELASTASISLYSGVCRTNILSLPQREASRRLGSHLWNNPFEVSDPSNLVSWRDPLLFVLQYAIFRSHEHVLPPSDVYICALDTSNYLKGQFARDMWLIRKCHDTTWTEDTLKELKSLRQRRGYNNGEKLSQGLVDIRGRSCVFTLQKIIDAGMFELYPELNDGEGRKEWTNRVRALRSFWAFPSSTTQ